MVNLFSRFWRFVLPGKPKKHSSEGLFLHCAFSVNGIDFWEKLWYILYVKSYDEDMRPPARFSERDLFGARVLNTSVDDTTSELCVRKCHTGCAR